MWSGRRFGALGFLLFIATGCDYSPAGPYDNPPPVQSRDEGLWTSSGAPAEILRFNPAQLPSTGSGLPSATITTFSGSLFTLNGIAFDSTGTLWVASEDDSALLAFSPGTAPSSLPIEANIVISAKAGSISGPTGLAFDHAGGLWVANAANGTLVHFDKSQLTASGAPVPTVILSGLGRPTSLAFDVVGALWVSDILANTVSRFLVGQLFTSGEKPAAIVLSSNSGSLVNPSGIAFDAFNNLWVANTGNETVVSFAVTQRGNTNAPVPHVTLTANQQSLVSPAGLAFDADGSLWVVGVSGIMTKFAAASLGASGSPVPDVRVTITNHLLFWSVAFWPTPAGLPIN